MNKAVPWNIKGVGFDAREVAHMAARRAGVPIGQWLDSVIADKARDLGVSATDFSEDERLDALVARLAGVAESVKADERYERARAAAPRMRAAADSTANAEPMARLSSDDRDTPPAAESTRRRPRAERDLDRGGPSRQRVPGWEQHLGLDEALDLARQRATADEARLSGDRQRMAVAAIAREVERLGRSEGLDPETNAVVRPSRRGGPLPETRDQSRRPLRDAVGSVAEQLEQIETRINHRDADLANRPIVAALGRLEDRFEHLMRRREDGTRDTARLEATFNDFDSRLREISQRLDQREQDVPARSIAEIERIDANLAAILKRLDGGGGNGAATATRQAPSRTETGAPRGPHREAVAEIARRQADLDQADQRRAALLREASYPSIGQAHREKRAAREELETGERTGIDRDFEGVAGLQEAFARLTDRMESRLEEAVRARAAQAQDQGIDALKSGIQALGERLDVIRQENERDRPSKDERDDIESLRNEISALQVGLTKLAPQSAITTLEDAIRALGGQINDSRREGVSEAVLAPIDRLRQEVRQALHGQDIRGTVESVDEQLRVLADRMDRFESRGLDGGAIGGLQSQVAEIRGFMEAAGRHFQAAERLQSEIGQLAGRVERLSESPQRPAVRDLELAVNEVRTMLVEFSPETALRDVGRQIAGLGDRLDAVEESLTAPAGMLDDFAKRIQEANSSLAERLIKAMPPAVDMAPIAQMIDGLSGKLDGVGQTAQEVNALGGLVRGLAEQMEEARAPSADAEILDKLESQVGRLAERLDHSDASLEAIASVERLVRELFEQVDESRAAAIEAAEGAARSAAQETLRAALVSPAVAGEEASARATRVVEQVGQELSEFRKAQQASEKRVHSTLLALNDTLERMVDRMIVSAEVARDIGPAAAPVEAPVSSGTDGEPVQRARPSEKAAGDKLSPSSDPVRVASKPVEVKVAGAQAKIAPPVEIGRHGPSEPMPDVSPLIAAARRAAQAAQASASAANRDADNRGKPEEAATKAGAARNWRSLFRQKRRPVLLSVASVVLLLGALQIVRMSQHEQQVATAGGRETVADAAPVTTKDDPSQAAPALAPSQAVATTTAGSSATVTAAEPAAAPAPAPATTQASLLSGDLTKTETATPPVTGFQPADKAPAAFPAGLREIADRGDAAAQYEVGARLADGKGVARDSKAAAAWFERAAKQGYAPAQYRLGSMYEKGTGVAVDASQAVAWYEKAANRGNIRAMHNLAVLAAEGGAGKPDYVRAASWFSKAAEHGVRDSQYNLAILYARGLGLTQDLGQSYTWFSIAAGQGDADAAKKRDDVAAKLDPAKLAAAKSAADAFKVIPADHASNDVTPPPGGWDVASPAKVPAGPKISSM